METVLETVLEKVLIVEDEVHARTGLTELIESWGYRAESAADGLEGLERRLRGLLRLSLPT